MVTAILPVIVTGLLQINANQVPQMLGQGPITLFGAGLERHVGYGVRIELHQNIVFHLFFVLHKKRPPTGAGDLQCRDIRRNGVTAAPVSGGGFKVVSEPYKIFYAWVWDSSLHEFPDPPLAQAGVFSNLFHAQAAGPYRVAGFFENICDIAFHEQHSAQVVA